MQGSTYLFFAALPASLPDSDMATIWRISLLVCGMISVATNIIQVPCSILVTVMSRPEAYVRPDPRQGRSAKAKRSLRNDCLQSKEPDVKLN